MLPIFLTYGVCGLANQQTKRLLSRPQVGLIKFCVIKLTPPNRCRSGRQFLWYKLILLFIAVYFGFYLKLALACQLIFI